MHLTKALQLSCACDYLKKSVVSHHTTSAKHKAAVAKVIARERNDISTVDALQKYKDDNHSKMQLKL